MKLLKSALLLRCLPRIGEKTAKKLVDNCGGIENVFSENKDKLLSINGIGESHLRGFEGLEKYFVEIEKEISFIEKNKITPLFYGEESYPSILSHCADAPIILFQKGNIKWNNNRKIISVVGTRTPTKEGIAFCKQLLKDLTPYNPIIVSGLARGIDIEAHKTALNLGLDTVACMGSGLNFIYPKEHRNVASKLTLQGGLLTEFWSSDPFERSNFLRRNRIIAGLSSATIVIESKERGGSLITAEFSNQYGRDTFAVPGRISDVNSKGCLNLIKQEKARMITKAEDIVYWLGWEEEKKSKDMQPKELFVSMTVEQESVYNQLSAKKTLDKLALELGLSISKTATILLQLELKGCVRSLPGKLYERF